MPQFFDVQNDLIIIFLLLIFFMTASIYSEVEKQIGIDVPYAETGSDKQRTPGEITININQDGRIFINSHERSLAQVEQTLKELAQIYKDHPIILRIDKEAAHKHFAAVFDLCQKYEIENINISTQEEKK